MLSISKRVAIIAAIILTNVFFQNLLHMKGFSTNEQVHLKSSSHPNSIRTPLKVMLQIARIINLDEVIYYSAIFA